ncbi:sensor histidine kinase [Pseudooceanicola sediminis]|uniref:histidine kinase n=1 Tax=Pseudooceanicola sediminis TaxID=2211117 RepID=A0A399J434_9RHOB|nr:ATP-binding protein [Pseudooceanicola sediminis]KAA2316279.1 sensor histidine kinase [Puniceibacterium sp. HSS470]RII39189.1 sensor histidine kinase [Pseudooceanicola sediminis]|tara:strand:- start:49928 stop:51379 length:1452 start_codon:yes stop_codon:yes gene_type:complete
MIGGSASLRRLGTIWMLSAFAAGGLAGGLWFGAQAAWDSYLGRAYVAGVTLWDSLARGSSTAAGVTMTPLPQDVIALADQGAFGRLPDVPVPAYVTQASIRDATNDDFGGLLLRLAIVSDGVQYEVAQLIPGDGRTAPEKLGHVTRLLASYCSQPILFAQMGEAPWQRIDGRAVWGCDAAPRDTRLAGILIALLALAAIYTRVSDTSGRFVQFAETLRSRRRLGGPQSYTAEGPEELGAIVEAVNAYLEAEREQLSRRATVLSGVSHDLGTPATRLRLRTALITDDDLRARFDSDIDRMTGMIESVLTYTRSELSVEEPRQISLSSLVQAIVADFQDIGLPVELSGVEPQTIQGGGSVFAARTRITALPDSGRVLVTARPVALQRAVTNLIDNALKYGRRAHVELAATSARAVIVIEDEGTEQRAEDVEALMQPFRRGGNAAAIDGFGLGLTIVTAVAEQHGGTLRFANGRRGLRAELEIQRS